MKLLFDQNLSFKLCRQIDDLFPGSAQVGRVGLAEAKDLAIWDYAKGHEFVLVSLDSDFAELAATRRPPPKVIWLRHGNQPTAAILKTLRSHADAIRDFARDSDSACFEIY